LLIELNALKREYYSKRTSEERRREIAEDIHFYLLDLEPIDPFHFKRVKGDDLGGDLYTTWEGREGE